MRKVTLRKWIKNFNEGDFESPDVKTQMDAGWFDWFCRDTSLKNKTKKMGNIIKQIKDGGKVDLDKTFVWFKNNCPMSGPLYDDFRIANISDGATQLIIQINSPFEVSKYKVCIFDKSSFIDDFETNSSRDLVKWFNNEI